MSKNFKSFKNDFRAMFFRRVDKNMLKFQKIEKFEAFEYGSGEFPIWFNVLVSGKITLFDDCVYTPKEKSGCYAGKFNETGRMFKYGDIIVKMGNGKIHSYSKEKFLEKFGTFL